jgi:transposase
MLLADRGYDADWIRELAMKKGAWANIPPKSNRSDPICYDRLAANHLAFVQLASIRLWLQNKIRGERGSPRIGV